MIQTIQPGPRTGSVRIPASKSIAHRYLIAAALSGNPSVIECRGVSGDIQATIRCLKGLGAHITCDNDRINVLPVSQNVCQTDSGQVSVLDCSESGSTLRFLLPVAGALNRSAVFHMEGRLPERPMESYEQVLQEHGMQLHREGSQLFCSGELKPGLFELPGNISSQYFTGLLFALPLLDGTSCIRIRGRLESADYVTLTEQVLKESGILWERTEDGYRIPGRQSYQLPSCVKTEGDYSSGAFFLCAGAISGSEGILAENLSAASLQGDRRITEVLRRFGAEVIRTDNTVRVLGGSLKGISIDASMIPDLIPVLSVVAAAADGETVIHHAERLRMKESDRIRSTVQMLTALGADVKETDDGMIIHGQPSLCGGCLVDSFGDHRIAMSAAVASCITRQPVRVDRAECVEKSYPAFWNDFASLQLRG